MRQLLISNIIQPLVEGNESFFERKATADDFEGLMDPIKKINHFETTADFGGIQSNTHLAQLSYIFEDSASFKTIDSFGNHVEITPGSLLWVVNEKAIEYSQGPIQQGSKVEGVQIFLNIPENRKTFIPTTLAIAGNKIGLIENGGVRVKVLCGRSGDASCKIKTPQAITMLHISLQPGKEFVHVLPANWSGTVLGIGGRFDLMTSEETFELDEGMVISMAYSDYNESIRFTALTASELIFISGEPVQENLPSRKIQGREPHLIPAGSPGFLF